MVGVPIGNLSDITVRALEILKNVDTVACEDTRHSSILLKHYAISKPLVSCHGHNEEGASVKIVAKLSEGKDVAFMSDAGTPGISDPGGRLVAAAIAAGHEVVPLPGPSALTTLLSVLGMPGKRICFEGFLSPKAGRRRNQLGALYQSGDISIIYESPFRILALLADIAAMAPEAWVVAGRELTKMHEEILRGTALEIQEALAARPSVKGEFAVAFGHPKNGKAADDDERDDNANP